MSFLVNKEEVLNKVKLVILKIFFIALKGRYEDRRFLADSTTTMEFPVIYVLVQLYPWFKFYLPLFWGMVMHV